MVGYPERLGGGDVPRGPDRDPVHGQQFWGLAHHGEGIHEGRDEDQGGRLSGRVQLVSVSGPISGPFECRDIL